MSVFSLGILRLEDNQTHWSESFRIHRNQFIQDDEKVWTPIDATGDGSVAG